MTFKIWCTSRTHIRTFLRFHGFPESDRFRTFLIIKGNENLIIVEIDGIDEGIHQCLPLLRLGHIQLAEAKQPKADELLFHLWLSQPFLCNAGLQFFSLIFQSFQPFLGRAGQNAHLDSIQHIGDAKSIEEIKSFLSKQKETYKVPYETHPADRLRQCVFAGTTNRQDFLPRDRTGNRRFIPVPVDAELGEVHILDNEEESRTYIDQLWAEAMTIYNRGDYKLAFSPAMQETLQAHQQDFMQEDAQAGMIYAFLEDYAGDRVCSKQLYAEALGNTNIPAEWETRAICEIMNTGISRGDIQGWQAHKTAKRYPKYGVQKGWERVTSPETGAEDFSEITDAEAKQLGFPF